VCAVVCREQTWPRDVTPIIPNRTLLVLTYPAFDLKLLAYVDSQCETQKLKLFIHHAVSETK